MAQSGQTSEATGAMDVSEQRQTFSAFMQVTVWTCLLIAMSVAGLVVAFAMNIGWFPGVATYAVLGVIGGAVMRMGGAWWTTVIVSAVVLALGGALVMGVLALV